MIALLLLIAAAGTPPGGAVTPGAASSSPAAASCPADVDLAGLIEALATVGLQATTDAADMLEAYHNERDALCRRLDARGDMLTALRESLELTRQMLDLERAMRAMYQHDLAEALKRRAPARRRLFACVTGGAAGASIGGEGFAGPAVACGWPLF